MQIEYESSGGFANLQRAVRVDTQALAPELAANIEGLVAAANFFDASGQAAAVPPASAMRDGLSYRLTITDNDRHRSLELTDMTVPVNLRPLLQLLQQMAIRKQGV